MFPENSAFRAYGYGCNACHGRKRRSGWIAQPFAADHSILPSTKPSEWLDGEGKHVADAALGPNDRRRGRIGFQLAPKPQHLDIDAAIEDILVDTSCLQELLSREGALRSVSEVHIRPWST